jgi:phosphopantetheine adenylyltransferase
MSDAMFQANAGNIGLLRDDLVSDLVVFYNRVEQFQTRVVALQSLLERYNNSTDTSVDKEFMIAAIQKTIDLMTEIITLGEELAPRLL